MPPVETEYYDLLGVPTDIKILRALGRAWHDATMKCQEEMDPPEAVEMTRELYKAYRVLSNPRLRASYDKNGKSMMNEYQESDFHKYDPYKKGYATEESIESTRKWLAEILGGEKFVPYTGGIQAPSFLGVGQEGEADRPGFPPREQRDAQARLWEERAENLSKQLIERLRPFAEAKNPGDSNDPETLAFRDRMRSEAEDLKSENLGINLLYMIGSVYEAEATSFLNPKGPARVPQFLSFGEDIETLQRDAWGIVFSQGAFFETQGEIPAEQLGSLQWNGMSVVTKVIQGCWMLFRALYVKILREVCEKVLRDPTVSESVRVNRAKGLLIIGTTFKTQPDEPALDFQGLMQIIFGIIAERWMASLQPPAPERPRKKKSLPTPSNPRKSWLSFKPLLNGINWVRKKLA